MNLIKTPSAAGRTNSELSNLKFHIWFLVLIGCAFFPHNVKLGKITPCFAKQTQFQNTPFNANPFITNDYENQACYPNRKQTQFKADSNPNKANLPPLTTQKFKNKPKQTRFKPNKRCNQRGTPQTKTDSNPISGASCVVHRPIKPCHRCNIPRPATPSRLYRQQSFEHYPDIAQLQPGHEISLLPVTYLCAVTKLTSKPLKNVRTIPKAQNQTNFRQYKHYYMSLANDNFNKTNEKCRPG